MAHHHDERVPAARGTAARPGNSAETAREVAPAHGPQQHEMAPGAHEHGPDRHAGHSVEMFRRRFWLSLVLTIPTVAFGHMIPSALGREPPSFPGSWLIPPLFGTIVFLYGGWPFLEGAWRELRARLPGMMTLIALAISVAFTFSAAVTVGYPGMPLWEELSTLVTIMLLGHWIEMRSISQAHGALRELAKLLPRTAVRIVSGREEEIPIEGLHEGDLVLVRPGASVPADGVVRSGESSLDEAMITGESRPVARRPGDQVVAGTVNGAGSLRVEITGTGEGTALARIMGLVARAQGSRSRAQALADRAALLLTFVAIVAAAATAVGWWIAGASGAFIAERVVTVLVIACPHALGLAIPLVIAISTTLAARAGLLVRNRRGLEEARRLEVVVFDKTGTLTLGQHRVVAVKAADGISEFHALRFAAAVERDSEHPVARAVFKTAQERGIEVPPATLFRAIPGQGAEAEVDGHHWMVGGPNLLRGVKATAPPELEQFARDAAGRGDAVIHLVDGGRVRASFAVADAVRPEAREAVRDLHQAGIRVVMLTGDARAVAEAVARDLGIEEVHAEVVPEKKAEAIAALKRGGHHVAMVGDGVNDAPALVTADVGVAMGAGTDVAVDAGDVVLVRSDPRAVSRIMALSRATYRKMIQNLWWAAGYNVVAIPLAAGVLASWGVLLGPAVGAVLMSASTVIVALNAQLLRRATA